MFPAVRSIFASISTVDRKLKSNHKFGGYFTIPKYSSQFWCYSEITFSRVYSIKIYSLSHTNYEWRWENRYLSCRYMTDAKCSSDVKCMEVDFRFQMVSTANITVDMTLKWFQFLFGALNSYCRLLPGFQTYHDIEIWPVIRATILSAASHQFSRQWKFEENANFNRTLLKNIP